MKKKLLVLALALAMVFSLAGCLQLETVKSISLVESPSATYNYGDPSQEFNFSIAVEKEDTYLVRFNATAADFEEGPVTQNGVTVTGFNVMSYGTRTATISYGTAASIQFEYTVNVNYSAGEGTAADPYQIQDAEQMAYMLAEDSAEGKYFKLIADIDFSAMDMNLYTETLEANPVFTGTFDGNGHAIKNFVNTNSIGTKAHGVFFMLEDATIKNVDLVDCIVDTYSEGSALLAYGSGKATAITVENVNILATQEGASYVAGWKNIGGMIGYARKDVALTIRNCENNANVTNYGQYGAGGFVGTLTENVNNAVIFENCVNNGNITGVTRVGALVGNTSFGAKYNGFAAVNCKNTGKITYAQYFDGGYFSVFVGADNNNKAQLAAFTGCENTGAVSMTADQEAKLDSAYMNYATPVFDVKSFSAEISIANNGAVAFGSVEGADYYIVSFYTFTHPASSSVKIVYEVGATSGSVIIPGTVKVGEKTYTYASANNDTVATLEGVSLDVNSTYVTVSAYEEVEEGMDRLISAESKQVKLTEVK